jgi:hypothetical protein
MAFSFGKERNSMYVLLRLPYVHESPTSKELRILLFYASTHDTYSLARYYVHTVQAGLGCGVLVTACALAERPGRRPDGTRVDGPGGGGSSARPPPSTSRGPWPDDRPTPPTLWWSVCSLAFLGGFMRSKSVRKRGILNSYVGWIEFLPQNIA